MERRFGVVAGSPQRAKTLFRELSLEQGFDTCWSVNTVDEYSRGYMLDTLFIDQSASPMPRRTMDRLAGVLRGRGGTAYVLSQLQASDIDERR